MAEQPLEFILPLNVEEDKNRVFEQYKMLVESINKINELRETSNNFWITVNGLGLTGIAYIKEAQTLPGEHKVLLLWTLIGLGIFLCLTWLNFLAAIKRSSQVKSKILFEIEKNFPIKVFTRVFDLTQEQGDKALTLKEMLVPTMFLLGYIFFGVLLYSFTGEVIVPSKVA